MSLKEKIRAFITENMAIIDGDITINDRDNIFEKGFVDSMFAMKLVAFLENDFKIEILDSDLDLSNFSSVQNIVSFLEKKKSLRGNFDV